MQNLVVTSNFVNVPKTDGKGLGKSFAKGFAAMLVAMLITVNLGHKAMASAAEHQAVLDLVPVQAANRQVVQSGPWSNPATWGGTLPSAGQNLYVPAGKALQVDVFNDSAFGTLRVDGNISFVSSANVRIKVDTLVVTSTGSFEVGAELARVPNTKKIEIVIANNGSINRSWDPNNISRGVILQGKTRIYGSNKSAYHELAVDPAAGSTQIQLATTPVGWVKGDIIAITATKFRRKKPTDTSYQTEDELRRILAISGKTVMLGSVANSNTVEPLQYSHVPTSANMPVYVANLTRNVVFRGEAGDAIPVAERPHFMVMHNPDTIIKGAGFYHLGRTDKSIPLNDYKLDANGKRVVDAQGNYIPDVKTNPRGRYAVHFHHTGVADPTAQPVICSGNAVISSPGWGFVNHTSNVVMQNNASYNVLGSHFVTEDGNELGVFRHNIAIKSSGRASTNVTTGIKDGIGNHDHGHSAHGFWFHNRNILVDDNVASGTYGAGMIFYTRNAVKGIDLKIPKANLLVDDKSIVKDAQTIEFYDIPLRLRNLTVVASSVALIDIKGNPAPAHDARSLFESVKGYSVLDGIKVEYLSKYTFKDVELVADINSHEWNKGFDVSRNSRDITLINAKIDDFVHPIVTGTVFVEKPDQTDVAFVNVLVDGRPMIAQNDIHQPSNLVISNYDPAFHQVLNTMPVTTSAMNFVQSNQASYDLPIRLANEFKVKGVKTDSLGKKAFESTWNDISLMSNLKKGYYTRPDGSKFVILTENLVDRVTGQTYTISTRANLLSSYDRNILGPHLGMVSN